MTSRHLALLLAFTASAAIAHANVSNPSVKARMDMMDQIKDATGVLGNMAKQPGTYDAAAAEAAKTALVTLSGQIPAAFEDKATDPESEAAPAIWDNWDDFVAKSNALNSAAAAMDTGSADGIAAGMQAIGGACGGCHKPYRL